MTLDVFTQKLGEETMPRLDADNTGIVAVQMLDAIQTVVNVLTDNDGGKGWTVSYDPTLNAYTDRSAARRIVVSVKPLLDAKPGDRLDKVAAIMTGFAVHEVGHTKLDFYTAISKRWPGKDLPKVVGNIIEDVVLELRTVERFPGFADQGQGNVFRPTLEWVADISCPKYPLKWAGSSGHKVNVVGQIVRYRDFVTFSEDKATQDALAWVDQWAERITPAIGPSDCVALIEDLLAYMKATLADETPDETPKPKGPEGENPDGGQSIPDEDDDDTEGGDGDGDSDEGDDDADTEGGSEGDGLDDPDTDDGDGKGDGEAESGEDERGSDSDTEDEDSDGTTEGGGEETGPGRGDGNDADTLNRVDLDGATNDGEGAGGSGQGVGEASTEEDPDAGFDKSEVADSFDELASPDSNKFQQQRIATAEADERVTTRVDAGAFGKMRVIFK